MKHKYLLSTSIPIGILLSGCVCDTAVMQSETGDKLHIAPVAKYVKHNQGLEIPNQRKEYVKHNQSAKGPNQRKVAKTSAAQSTAYISVHLVPISGGQEIEYWITDMNGISGAKHSRDTGNNETATSDLFTTTFAPGTDIKVIRADGEVIIKGKAADGKRYAWKSDSSQYQLDPLDSDVIWNRQ